MLLAALAGAVAADAASAASPALTLARAERVVSAALAEARRLEAPGAAVAVVDLSGYPLAVARLDGTFAAAGEISTGKARTAALFGRPSKVLEDAINQGRTAMTALAPAVGAVPLRGGVPLLLDGALVGAVGVSGAASADQDSAIAEAAAPAVADPASLAGPAPAHFDAASARAAFEAGRPLVETAGYKVHASRRVQPGEAEVHTLDTDIFYVLEGEATLVLGGALVEPRAVSPSEIRARAIAGGQEHPLRAGDVVVVPAGTPHWFRDVARAPVLYFAVKATAGAR